MVRRHQNQILPRSTPTVPTTPIRTFSPAISDKSAHSPIGSGGVDEPKGGAEVEVPPELATPVRRSARIVKPPSRLDL